MEIIKLSKRLETVAKFVKEDEIMADIGSDHAYLPIYLIQKNIVPQAIAGEAAVGPLKNARQQVALFQLAEKIAVRLGDGLNSLIAKDEIGTVTVCGMGGSLIAAILKDGFNKGKVPREARLVLQPNHAEKPLRKLLAEQQYEIIGEEILEENNKIYEVIVAEPSKEKIQYSNEELIFGPLLLKKKPLIFSKKWRKELHRNERILEQLKNTAKTEKKEAAQRKIQQIKKVLS